MGQASILPTQAGIDLTGKTVIVTGANSGLGLESARQYLTLNASRVILAVRTVSKGEEAAKHLSSHPSVKAANPGAEIKVMQLDLDDYQSVHQFVEDVKKEIGALDILLLNAGVNLVGYQMSKSGHERVIQVNYLSNVLLALELLPLLELAVTERGSPGRLTFVGSKFHEMHTLRRLPVADNEGITEHFDDKSKYGSLLRYSDSKLMVVAFVQAAAQHIPVTRVVINNFCPGMIATDFDVHLPIWLRLISGLQRKLFAKAVEDGGRAAIYASAVIGEESHGKFISSNRITEPAPLLAQPEGKALKEKLWDEAIREERAINANSKPGLV